MFDNFQFDLYADFPGYISSRDKTLLKEGFLVRGSQNIYKKISGTIANRFGLKLRGAVDSTVAGVKSSYDWKNVQGITTEIRVANNKMQVESSVTGTPVWYDLLETASLLSPARTLTRMSYAVWYEIAEAKKRMLFVRGDSNMLHWSGGITKIASASGISDSSVLGTISAAAVNAGGTGYSVGDVLTVTSGGGTGGTLTVATLSGTAVATVSIQNPGSGYSPTVGATTSSSSTGTGATFNISTTDISGMSITKSDTTTTWAQDGFASIYSSEKRLVINISGVPTEFSYGGGENTTTLTGVTPVLNTIIANSIAVQSVIVSASDPIAGTNPVALPINDMVETVGGQAFVASYSNSKVLISARSSNRALGFLDNVNVGSLLPGDPDFAVLDSSPTGLKPKDGKMYVSAGSQDWYIITPNKSVPTGFAGQTGTYYIITDVEKVPGTGLVAAKSHEFIESFGGDIVYLSQDNQLRTFSTSSRSIFTKKFPSFSQEINDELFNEDFTGGHLKAIGDFLFLTAPNSGRHYMYQIRESVDKVGNVVADRIWHPPQIAGISRFAEINGVTYGHSNQYPQVYQYWDTNQWHDDSPSGNLPYTSVAAFAYKHYGIRGKEPEDRVMTARFDKSYFEGYMTQGTNLYCNVYFDYQGSTTIQSLIVNSNAKLATFYSGLIDVTIGQNGLGGNPLGDGLVTEPNEQSLLPKFRKICDINPVDSFEHQLVVFSNDEDSRWELICVGTNIEKSPSSPVELRRSS